MPSHSGSDRYGMRSHASWGSQEDVMPRVPQPGRLRQIPSVEGGLRTAQGTRKAAERRQGQGRKSSRRKEKGKDKKKRTIRTMTMTPRPTRRQSMSSSTVCATEWYASPHVIVVGRLHRHRRWRDLYFFAEFDDGYDLWKTDLRKHETSMVKKLGYRHRSIQTDKDGNTLYLLGSDGLGKMSVSSETIKPIKYSATMKNRPQGRTRIHVQLCKAGGSSSLL